MNNNATTDYVVNQGPRGWQQEGSISGLAHALRTQEPQCADIKEPSVYAKAEEALAYIREAEDVAFQISCRVGSPGVLKNNENSAKEVELSLVGLLAVSSQRAACLVSLLRTISAKIG